MCAQSIALISDINGRYGSTDYHDRVSRAINSIVESRHDLVISTGDLVAGQKTQLKGDQIDQMWRGFDSTVGKPLSKAGIEFITTPGNHDGSALPGFEREQEKYLEHWSQRPPKLELTANSDWPRRYAVWFDDILIIAIDGTLPGRLQAADMRLLSNTLEQESGRAASVIVLSHLPLWPFAQGREKEVIRDDRLNDLFEQNKVDLFISGHHHVFYPGVDQSGVIHIAVGALGGNARKLVDSNRHEPFSYAVINMCDPGFNLSARKAPEFTDAVQLADLPETIHGPMGVLTRIDLATNSRLKPCTH